MQENLRSRLQAMADEQKHTPFLSPADPEPAVSTRTWLIAAGAVVLLLVIAAVATLRKAPADTGAALASDANAAQLPISDRSMSEATNGAGGKSTYLDGTITNNTGKTLTGATVQVSFATTDGTQPHRETSPLMLVRTRVPYVDLQMVSADPIKPGDHRDFRLIFESVPANWDVQPPTIVLTHAELK